MADLLPIEVPSNYLRSRNRDHTGSLYPISDDLRFDYGTAGFRMVANLLPFAVFRIGYVAGLRSRVLNKCIGIMITASHNPEIDNGVKIVDPMGEMLSSDWEKIATELVNAKDDQLPTTIRALEVQMAPLRSASNASVVCAMDTRISSPHLVEAARAGAELFNVHFRNHGLLTTPQLHYIVRCRNDPEFGEASEVGYYKCLSTAFNELLSLTPGEKSKLRVDCANGIGAPKFKELMTYLNESLDIEYANTKGELNHNCGADFVKISQTLPVGFEECLVNEKCASFDGDADRLVYFKRKSNDENNVSLLDGDKIAVLLTKYIKEQLDVAGLNDDLSLGIIQTAYANGASSQYIKDALGINAVFVPTGVKHLHHAAIKFDIGIYFEANGHGTVVFSSKFDNLVRKSEKSNDGVRRLALISRVINEVVGDAMADLLAVEIILRHYGWTVENWQEQLYKDFPNVQIKVPVVDRSIYKTTWDETTLIEPPGLQEKINELIAKYPKARSFVRPSGTECLVRVYAEAETSEDTTALGAAIADLVRA
ncbi:unnamed protein product [Auanema sp. JU1783]|nr:unnamed protein product [Auanema sp. JU1783]